MVGTTKEMSIFKQVLRYHLDGVFNRKSQEGRKRLVADIL